MPQTKFKWMSINTAPKGSGENGPISIKDPKYIKTPDILLYTSDGCVVGHYDWYYHKGYGIGASCDVSAWRDSLHGEGVWPTHWMPLPFSPTNYTSTKRRKTN